MSPTLHTARFGGRGRWRAAGNRAKESEGSTYRHWTQDQGPAQPKSCPPNPQSVSACIHTQTAVLTHPHTLSQVQAPSCPVSHMSFTDTTAPMACDHEVNHSARCWGECEQTATFPHAPPRCCPQVHARCSLHTRCTWWWAHTCVHTEVPLH